MPGVLHRGGDGVRIFGIDPGPEASGFVGIDPNGRPFFCDVISNDEILARLKLPPPVYETLLAIESMANYGMPVGEDVFKTCYWIGRFAESWSWPVRLIKAPAVRAHICGVVKAKKAHVRRALMDRYERTGGGANPEIGTKTKPGPLYGFKSHAWSALAVAVAARESEELGEVL
jgi:hypothetical protein